MQYLAKQEKFLLNKTEIPGMASLRTEKGYETKTGNHSPGESHH